MSSRSAIRSPTTSSDVNSPPRFGLRATILGHLVLYAVYVWAARRDLGDLLVDRRSAILLSLAAVVVVMVPFFTTIGASARVAVGACLALASVAAGLTRSEWERIPRPLRRTPLLAP